MEIGKPSIVNILYIYDGDTIVTREGIKLRANYIDTPEMNYGQSSSNPSLIAHWQWAKKAHDYLNSLVRGQEVIVIPSGVDIYGRCLSDWYLNIVSKSNNIQLAIARLGLCAYYAPYQKYDFSNRELNLYLAVMKNCIMAKRNGVGFWQIPNFILPYQYRSMQI